MCTYGVLWAFYAVEKKSVKNGNTFGVEAALGHLFVLCLNSLLALFLNHHYHRSQTAE